VPGILGAAAEALYSAAVSRRNRAYDAGKGVTRFDRPVISIGNLSVGGTGKTPMVMHCVRTLLDADVSPCIAMRGYRADKGGESDEASLYLKAFAEVPVVAQPDRIAGLEDLFASERGGPVECVVLDDGFQHRKIAREHDIVLVDASRDPFHDRMLPAGWLREPVASLERAHAVVVTHAEMVEDDDLARLRDQIEHMHGRPPAAVTRHDWAELLVGDAAEPVEWLQDLPCVAVCAVGNPEPFMRRARQLTKGRLLAEMVLRDHDPYHERTVDRIVEMARGSRARAILCTEKDYAKLARVPAGVWPCPLVRPKLRIVFDHGREAFDEQIVRTGRMRVSV